MRPWLDQAHGCPRAGYDGFMSNRTVSTYSSAETARIQAWPMLKWRRAVEHMHGLSARVDIFNERRTYAAPIRLSTDGTALQFLRPDGVQPPLEEWALYFADAVHNLRASLDSLAWELSVAQGTVPANPRRVYFPVAQTEADWKSAVAGLDTVDEEFLARIKRVQPFFEEGPAEDHLLSILTRLDNAEKHRRTLVSRFDLFELEFGGTWKFEEAEAQGEAGFLVHTLEDPKPGEVVAEFHWGAPITQTSDEPGSAPMAVTPMVTLDDRYFPALEFLPQAAEWVRHTIDFVRRGEAATTEPLDEPA